MTLVATTEYLQAQIAEKETRIKSLEEHIQKITQRDYATAASLSTMRDQMHGWTIEALESREISETNAEEIADICGFELTKEVDVDVTVSYNFTVMVPVGENVEDIIGEIDFDSIDYDTDKISYVTASVDSIDF